MHRSGFVALAGRPNTGKSTLLNALVGQKVAIISDKPQTTRNRIRAVLTLEEAQVVFVDTPGLHKPKHKLGDYMVRAATNALKEVDLVCFIVEAHLEPGKGDHYIASLMEQTAARVFLVMNKLDLALPEELAMREAAYRRLYPFEAVFQLSAKKRQRLQPLIEAIVHVLPEGPRYYPDGEVTDQPERQLAAEIIREKIINLTREELPFAVAVVIESMVPRTGNQGLLDISAVIYVERKSQAGIIIGREGELLKEAGTRARHDLEALLGRRVYLQLWVKVKQNWRNREGDLRDLGYYRI